MKRVVDIFAQDWTHEIVWTYVITIGDDATVIDIDAFEYEAMRLALAEGKGTVKTIFAKARE